MLGRPSRLGDDLLHFIDLSLGTSISSELYDKDAVSHSCPQRKVSPVSTMAAVVTASMVVSCMIALHLANAAFSHMTTNQKLESGLCQAFPCMPNKIIHHRHRRGKGTVNSLSSSLASVLSYLERSSTIPPRDVRMGQGPRLL